MRNLTTPFFLQLEEAHLQSFFTLENNHSPEQRGAIHHSNEALKEQRKTDTIVIGAPLYNFGVLSVLKSWIEHIA